MADVQNEAVFWKKESRHEAIRRGSRSASFFKLGSYDSFDFIHRLYFHFSSFSLALLVLIFCYVLEIDLMIDCC